MTNLSNLQNLPSDCLGKHSKSHTPLQSYSTFYDNAEDIISFYNPKSLISRMKRSAFGIDDTVFCNSRAIKLKTLQLPSA